MTFIQGQDGGRSGQEMSERGRRVGPRLNLTRVDLKLAVENKAFSDL
jgi:hypothetical protein